MAPPSRIRVLEVPPGAPPWVATLLRPLNEALGQSAAALGHRLTFEENFQAEVKDVSFTAPYPVWTTPTFSGAWAQYGDTTYEQVRYRIDERGRVYLEGLAAGGTIAGTVFSLPVGYRPALNSIFPTISSSGAYSELRVLGDGSVRAEVGANTYFSVRCAFDATAPALPAVSGPVALVKHGLPSVAMVLPVSCRADGVGLYNSSGVPSLDWELASDGTVRLKSVPGLTPGVRYSLRLLLVAR